MRMKCDIRFDIIKHLQQLITFEGVQQFHSNFTEG